MPDQDSYQIRVYVGTYTRSETDGIHIYAMDTSSGALSFLSKVEGVENASFLAIDPQQRHLYAVHEVEEFEGKPGGGVSAFSIDRDTGGLTYLNRQSTGGAGPCHLTVDETGSYLLLANYLSGSLAVFPIEQDGKLSEASHLVQHRGSSVDPTRQEGPHAHSVTLDAANRYLFAADLGIDKIMVYRLNLTEGKLEPNDVPSVDLKAGAGPRHFCFHPSGEYAFIINELDSTLTSFAYDSDHGTLAEIETVATLPQDFDGASHCADLHVSPSGRFVYGSNRGHDSIVIFEIEPSTGRLGYIGHESTRGETPRNFAIDPTGSLLLAANQNTDTIVTFRIDQRTGRLQATGDVVEVPMPVCLKMVPASA